MKTYMIALGAVLGFLLTMGPVQAQSSIPTHDQLHAGWKGPVGAPQKAGSPKPKDDKESTKKKDRKKKAEDEKKKYDDQKDTFDKYNKTQQGKDGSNYREGTYYDPYVPYNFPDLTYDRMRKALATQKTISDTYKRLYDEQE